MYLMIDNYDSFVHNLARYFIELGEEILMVRNDRITLPQIQNLIDDSLKGILISPGPKSPKDCGISKDIVSLFAGQIPILGVCLGHQIIADVFGADIIKGQRPMHGKISHIYHQQTGLFSTLPKDYLVTRYHSLIVDSHTFPQCLEVDAVSEDGVLMALHHKQYPIYGVQFHPEAAMTQYGHELIQNFIIISNNWWRKTCQIQS